jgi:hypothetical protein
VLYVCGRRMRGLKRRRVGARVRRRLEGRSPRGDGRRGAGVRGRAEREVRARGRGLRLVREAAGHRRRDRGRSRVRALAAVVPARHRALARGQPRRSTRDRRAEQRQHEQRRCETSQHRGHKITPSRTVRQAPCLEGGRRQRQSAGNTGRLPSLNTTGCLLLLLPVFFFNCFPPCRLPLPSASSQWPAGFRPALGKFSQRAAGSACVGRRKRAAPRRRGRTAHTLQFTLRLLKGRVYRPRAEARGGEWR